MQMSKNDENDENETFCSREPKLKLYDVMEHAVLYHVK